jgi:hypothetical protein
MQETGEARKERGEKVGSGEDSDTIRSRVICRVSVKLIGIFGAYQCCRTIPLLRAVLVR